VRRLPGATLQRSAVAVGAAVAVAVAVPASLASLAIDEGSSLLFPFFAAVLLGFVAGGFVAGRRAPAAPYSNAAVAALAAYTLVQGVGTVRRSVAGEPVSLVQMVFNGLLAYASGLLGGVLASTTRSGTAPR
jgi:hypothetical protein